MADEKTHVDAVTGTACDVVRAADNADRDIRHVIVGTATIGKPRGIRHVGESAEPFLLIRLRRRNFEIEPQEL